MNYDVFKRPAMFFISRETYLIIIQVPVLEPENDSLYKQCNGRSGPYPDKIWVSDNWSKDEAESVAESVGKQEQRHDKCLHSWWRSSVGELIGCHITEAFGDGAQRDIRDLNPDRQWGDTFACLCVIGG